MKDIPEGSYLAYPLLDTLLQAKPEFIPAVELYTALMAVPNGLTSQAVTIDLDPPTARKKLAQGIPLFTGAILAFDEIQMQEYFIHFCREIESRAAITGSSSPYSPENQASIDTIRTQAVAIRTAVETHRLDLLELIAAVIQRHSEPLDSTAQNLGLDVRILAVLIRSCVKPALRTTMAEISRELDLGSWQRGLCPFCGELPAFAELQGIVRSRHLRCSLCGSDWSYPRLTCVYCETSDVNALGILYLEEHIHKYSIQTCDRCGGYTKTITTFAPTPSERLSIEDLATLQLDLIAVDHGYHRPPAVAYPSMDEYTSRKDAKPLSIFD